jgi:catechol 2,3-dioxygenase-like lactoylglutathione lyase family enzyme
LLGLDHVDLRVRDLAAVRAFYDALLPELGLVDVREFENGVEYYEPERPDAARVFFGLHEDPAHRPNGSRVAFSAATPADVDRLAEVVRNAGGQAIEGPEIPQSLERYYAVFFEDPDGNKLEICFRRAHADPSRVALEALTERVDAIAKGAGGA